MTYHPTDSDDDGTVEADVDNQSVSTDSAVIATELGLPEYDDVSNAPQTQGQLVYATGNGTSAEGIYKHDGSSYSQVGGASSEWQEDGNGNIVPIDDETVGDGTTTADHQSVSADTSLTDPAGVSHTGELADASDVFSGNHGDLSNVGKNQHHQDPTAGTGLTDEGTNQFGLNVVATGSTTLSSGSATVDTGVGSGTTATFMIAIGPDTDDAEVAADIQAVSGGNYEVQIEETDTDVGNPIVRYDISRVR